ncbi:DNA-binding transcriptional MocR family regulator [Paenibacillus forsythiae]|uniref:DNA-binding transcriptional MocR family regulator n=1 Tax=Paenibacillus forsythiae TaxID=365616 RepID=A0ABU3H5V0_9BACL|nr:hypothetical protein [Paenibacillus forsythiae]MDT3426193.1 DNA-binding transcriptional MocR family regulator [Paenibacillus forsythiae]
MKSGMYAHHAKQMKSLYNHRIKHLREISQRLLPKECLYTIQSSGGLFSAIRIPDSRTEDLVKRMENRGVDVLPTDPQFLSSFPKLNLLRLSIIRTDEHDIEEGVSILAEELERAQHTSSSPKPFFWL